MKRFRLPIFIIVLVICVTGVWFFGWHRPNQKLRNAEPQEIYNTMPTMPKQPTQQQQVTEITTIELSEDKRSEDVKNDVKPETMPIDPTKNIVENEQKESNENKTPSLDQEVSKHSPEEEESDTSKQLKKQAEATLIEGAALLAEAHIQIVNQLESKPVEKQVEMLNQLKETMINALHPITEEPLFEKEEANTVWHNFYDGLISAGYTPPPGYEK